MRWPSLWKPPRSSGWAVDILDASELGDVKHQESAATAKSIENADGFAQVFPEHKFHIVNDLQKGGHIVGMTGDGVDQRPRAEAG